MRTSLYPPGYSHKHHQNITGSIKIEASRPAYTCRNHNCTYLSIAKCIFLCKLLMIPSAHKININLADVDLGVPE